MDIVDFLENSHLKFDMELFLIVIIFNTISKMTYYLNNYFSNNLLK